MSQQTMRLARAPQINSGPALPYADFLHCVSKPKSPQCRQGYRYAQDQAVRTAAVMPRSKRHVGLHCVAFIGPSCHHSPLSMSTISSPVSAWPASPNRSRPGPERSLHAGTHVTSTRSLHSQSISTPRHLASSVGLGPSCLAPWDASLLLCPRCVGLQRLKRHHALHAHASPHVL
ncbi:hypothetical protein BKA80DRAFT_277553 [Phyllosticta citrichinensis]